MARNSPVKIWIARHTPRREPKFHHDEIFEGAGRSTRELLTILIRGWDFRMLVIIVLVVEVQQWFFISQVMV